MRGRLIIHGDDFGAARLVGERVARALAHDGYTATLNVSGSPPENYPALYPWKGYLEIIVITQEEAAKRSGGGLRIAHEG